MSIQFSDLNILHDPRDRAMTVATVKLAMELDFDTIAINIDIGEYHMSNASADGETSAQEPPSKKRKKGKRQAKPIPEPFLVPPNELNLSLFNHQGKQFRQYTRITATLSDTADVHTFLKHPDVQKFDLIAVCPKTEQVFTAALQKPELDIITFDITEKPAWLNKSKLIGSAGDSGAAFEISYAPGLSDSSVRREVLSNCREVWRQAKGKQVILTSKAERPIQLRGPFDVANIGALFGLTPEEGRRAISNHAKNVILHAQTRRSIKGTMHVQSVKKAPASLLEKLMKIPEFRVEVEKVPKT